MIYIQSAAQYKTLKRFTFKIIIHQLSQSADRAILILEAEGIPGLHGSEIGILEAFGTFAGFANFL